jgi:putative inorganic carbon (HCO3(-)) transporter
MWCWVEVAALAAVAPCLLFPRLPTVGVAVILPCLWLVRGLLTGRFLPSSPLNLLLLPLLIMVAVSVWATPDLEFSLGKIAGTLLGIFVLEVGSGWISTWRRLVVAVALWAASGVALALLALFALPLRPRYAILAPLIDLLPARLELSVPPGSLNPNPMGGTMLLFLPLLLVAAWMLRGGKAAAGLPSRAAGLLTTAAWLGTVAAAGLCALVLVLTQSRGAWAGFLAGCLFLTCLRFRRLGRVLVVLAGLVLLVAAFYVVVAGESEGVEETLTESSSGIGLEARLEIWDRAIYGIQDFAFTGMGMNMFRRVVHLLYPLFVVPPETDIASAHNQWLQTALDLGIPGLVAYVALWAAVIRILLHAGRTASRPWGWWLAAALAAGLVSQFTFLQADSIPLGAKLGGLWWVAVCLGVALYRIQGCRVCLGAWATLEVLMLWALSSLAAIALVSECPYVALVLAGGGGVYVGWLATPPPPAKPPAGPAEGKA